MNSTNLSNGKSSSARTTELGDFQLSRITNDFMGNRAAPVHKDAHLPADRERQFAQVASQLGRDDLAWGDPTPIEVTELSDLRGLQSRNVTVDSRQSMFSGMSSAA